MQSRGGRCGGCWGGEGCRVFEAKGGGRVGGGTGRTQSGTGLGKWKGAGLKAQSKGGAGHDVWREQSMQNNKTSHRPVDPGVQRLCFLHSNRSNLLAAVRDNMKSMNDINLWCTRSSCRKLVRQTLNVLNLFCDGSTSRLILSCNMRTRQA